MSHRFSIAAIIVRYAKDSKIADCLASLRSSTRPPDEVCVIDNRPSDGLIDAMRSQFPQMNVFGQKHNIGFAAGCNEGIRRTQSDLLLILNDDSYLHRECIERLAREFDDTPRLAACQPKILAAADHEMFEYAGCSGGFLDMFGVPFLRGRILDTVERDCGQYGDVREILWASGAAFMMSRSVLSDVGLFDEVFFAHMEEIDLCWRMHLMAYLVKVIPDAVAYHFGGGTLAYESPLKTFFNYRNNWRMLLKNFSLWPLVVVIPARLALDLCTIPYFLYRRRPRFAVALVKALLAAFISLPSTLKARRRVQSRRKVSESGLHNLIYRRPLIIDYFLWRKRRFSQLRFPSSRSLTDMQRRRGTNSTRSDGMATKE